MLIGRYSIPHQATNNNKSMPTLDTLTTIVTDAAKLTVIGLLISAVTITGFIAVRILIIANTGA